MVDRVSQGAQVAALDAALARVKSRILTPALVIDLDAAEHNLRTFQRRVHDASASWRPHIKTVKQRTLTDLAIAQGITRFKCATLRELDLLCEAPTHPIEMDIVWAYPCTDAALSALSTRARPEGVSITLLADGPEHLRSLLDWARADGREWGVMLDVDVGMCRTGTPPDGWDPARLRALLDPTAPLQLRGLHGYDGHHTADARAEAHAAYDALVSLARALELDERHAIVTAGTHSYGHALSHAGLRRDPCNLEVSPGTLVLSDLRSAPAVEDLGLRQAVYVMSRVVSTGADRVTLDAGSKGLNPDIPPPHCTMLGWDGLCVAQPSEEHLPVHVPPGTPAPRRGDTVWLVPVHACTTVNLYQEVLYLRDGAFLRGGVVDAPGHSLWVDAPPGMGDGTREEHPST